MNLIDYFLDETGKKFDDVKSEIKELRNDIKEIKEFKISIIASARLTSFIVSALCGFLTFLGTLYLHGK